MKKPAIGHRAADFCLPGVDGKDYCLTSFQDKKVVVIVFTCNHCPYAQAYEERIVALQRDYAGQGVQVVAINSNDAAGYPEDSFDNMVRRARSKSFNFPYLRDETQRVARAFAAEYTPEAYVLDAQFKICYIGRVDDNWQQPAKVKSHDLRRAIDAVLSGQPVENAVTHAIGCTIKWKL